ncbi:hypothetical protein D3C76_981470 [compost metagenome]
METLEYAFREIVIDTKRRISHATSNAKEQYSGHNIIDIAYITGVHRSAKDVNKEQHDHDRHGDDGNNRVDATCGMANDTPTHDGGIA